MNIVFLSHSSFSGSFVVGSHHLARRMAAVGHNVWHVGPPVTPFHFLQTRNTIYAERISRALAGPAQEDGVTALEPLTLIPWQMARGFLRWFNLFVVTSNVPRILKKAFGPGEIDVLLIDDPRFAGMGPILKPKAIFYRPTDFYAEMKNDRRLFTVERQVLSRSAGVISTSQPVLQHALTLHPGLNSLLLQNGVDHPHFSTPMEEPEELKAIPHPRVVYVGAIDFRFDDQVVKVLAQRLPHVHFVLIGPAGESRFPAGGPANIHVLGAIPYARVPGFLQHSDVGLLPIIDNMANAGRSPMKLYEYGAAGLPVLASRTKELERRNEKFVHLFWNGDEAEQELKKMLESPPERAHIAASCMDQDWTSKTSALLNFVERCMGKKAPANGTAG